MKNDLKNVALMISIPKKHRNLLKRIVAERMVAHPDETINVTKVCRQIITEYLTSQYRPNIPGGQERND